MISGKIFLTFFMLLTLLCNLRNNKFSVHLRYKRKNVYLHYGIISFNDNMIFFILLEYNAYLPVMEVPIITKIE